MTFVLSAERGSYEDPHEAFRRYREYLERHRQRFPAGAFSLATADWYFSLGEPRSPHDARLESVVVVEVPSRERGGNRAVSIRIRLISAFRKGHIEFDYPLVHRYELTHEDRGGGHQDWRYDEFRLSEAGRVIHEIEWYGSRATGRWVIEASDVQYRWLPSDVRR